jgi:hypothetical protein
MKIVRVVCILLIIMCLFTGCGLVKNNNNQAAVGSTLTENTSHITPAPQKSKEGENARGNTLGNGVHLGVAAIQGEWIYYLNEARTGGEWIYQLNKDLKPPSLYRVNIHNGSKEKICDDAAHYINVLGEWIYFANFTESKGVVSGPIFKIKTDGTNRTKLNNDECRFINVIGDWIYYTNTSDEFRIYRMKTDGTGRKKLNDEESMCLNVTSEWIYYISLDDNSKNSKRNIYKMKTDGTDKQLVLAGNVGKIIVHGEWIYYFQGDESQGYKGNIYKMKLDGSEKTQVTADIAKSFNIAGGYIYYSKEVDNYRDYLYRVDLDGKNKKMIAQVGVGSIVGYWNYFYHRYAEWDELERIKLDGTGHEKVSNGKAINP